jgi:hypothetical protein
VEQPKIAVLKTNGDKLADANADVMNGVYCNVQQSVRNEIKKLLKRSKARMRKYEYDALFADVEKKDKWKLRLFREVDGELEWKENITSADVAQIRSARVKEIAEAFEAARLQSKRSNYAFLIQANRWKHIRNTYHKDGGTFGFDILIRPTRLGEEGRTTRLHVGHLSCAFVIHADLDETGKLGCGSDVLVRFVWGEELKRYRLWENLEPRMPRIESAVIDNLQTGDYAKLVQVCVEECNNAAAWAFPV